METFKKQYLTAGLLAVAILLSACTLPFGSSGDGEETEPEIVISPPGEDEKIVPIRGYLFRDDGRLVAVDYPAEEILKSLGEPLSEFEARSCAFGEQDRSYTYRHYRIDTYQEEGVEYISSITLMDDLVSTPEGIAIGDEAMRVKRLYGEPTTEDESQYVYEKEGMYLIFRMEDGIVTRVSYVTGKL